MIRLAKKSEHYIWRDEPLQGDVAAVRALVAATGVFNPEEIQVAGDLVEDFTTLGEASEFRFLFADTKEVLAGYTCYGRIPFTDERYDLYWIATSPLQQRRGLGQQLLAQTEKRIRALGGKALYAETSSRELYAPARVFYEAQGFDEVARLKNFYRDGDHKVMLCKGL
jgi:ribosomal protein S18 acetylase RimI-like enzyme